MEEKINEQTEVSTVSGEEKTEGGLTAEQVSLGKFKDVESLFKAYNSLQSEFTKRCQRLKELEQKAETEKNPEPAPAAQQGITDEDKEEALPLVRRFYDMGFNIEATIGTATFLKEHGIRTRMRRKISEGSEEILDSIRAGYVSYIINTRELRRGDHYADGVAIRRCAAENNVTIFTSLDTVRVLLDVLEETTITVSTIDS